MDRFYQILLIASFVALSWLSFMAVHEFGHVVTAWFSGGSVSRVVLHPMQISWTEFYRNPHPQWVAWGGPVLGSLLPLGFLAAARTVRSPALYLFQFFAGFCLVANGLYLLVDAFERGGDGGTLLRHGALSGIFSFSPRSLHQPAFDCGTGWDSISDLVQLMAESVMARRSHRRVCSPSWSRWSWFFTDDHVAGHNDNNRGKLNTIDEGEHQEKTCSLGFVGGGDIGRPVALRQDGRGTGR